MTRWRWAVVLVAVAGCEGRITSGTVNPQTGTPLPPTPTSPTTPGGPTPVGPPPDVPPTPAPPSVALCGTVPTGRGYVGLAGEHLEAGRADQAAGTDIHRPYRNLSYSNNWTVTTDIVPSIGGTSFSTPEHRDPGVGGSFGVVPRGWYEESTVGPFAIHVAFSFAFKACLYSFARSDYRNTRGWYEHVTFAPDATRARQFCEKMETSAWSRAPTTEEIDACVELAVDPVLEEETDVTRRWAYVCASVITSNTWLSY